MSPVGHNDLDYYRSEYEDGEAPWSRMSWLDQRTRSWLNDLSADLEPPVRALDLGCGEGRISELIAGEGIVTVGLDYLHRVLSRRKTTNGNEVKQNLSFVRGDALNPPFVRHSFSIVVDYGFLHHVRKRNWDRYRRVVGTLLRDEGYLFLNVFHRDDDHANNETRDWVYHRGHYDRFFTRETLANCLGDEFYIKQTSRMDEGSEHVFLSALCEKVTSSSASN